MWEHQTRVSVSVLGRGAGRGRRGGNGQGGGRQERPRVEQAAVSGAARRCRLCRRINHDLLNTLNLLSSWCDFSNTRLMRRLCARRLTLWVFLTLSLKRSIADHGQTEVCHDRLRGSNSPKSLSPWGGQKLNSRETLSRDFMPHQQPLSSVTPDSRALPRGTRDRPVPCVIGLLTPRHFPFRSFELFRTHVSARNST